MGRQSGIGQSAAVVTLLMVLGLASGAVADEERGESRLFVAERTTDGPATLNLQAGFGWGTHSAPDGLIGVAAVRDHPGEDVVAATDFSFITSAGGETLPYAYLNGERYDCSDFIDEEAGVCEMFVSGGGLGMGMVTSDDGGSDAPTRVFVAVHGNSPNASLGSQTVGWAIREVEPTFAFVRGSEAQAAGVNKLWAGAEAFLSATADGGEHGSVAIGQPPCGFPMFEPGAGVTRLVGGAGEPLHVCGADWGGIADFATDAATWQFEGAAAGGSPFFGIVRLVVIDLPPPCDEDNDDDCEAA